MSSTPVDPSVQSAPDAPSAGDAAASTTPAPSPDAAPASPATGADAGGTAGAPPGSPAMHRGHPGWSNRHAATRRAIEPEDLVPLDERPAAPAAPTPAAPAAPAAAAAAAAPAAPAAAAASTAASPAATAQPAAAEGAPDQAASTPAQGEPEEDLGDLGPDPWIGPIRRLKGVALTARRGMRAALATGGATATAGIGLSSIAVTMMPGAGAAAAAPGATQAAEASLAGGPWGQVVLRAAELWPAHWIGVVAVTLGAAMIAAAVAGGAEERAAQLNQARSREMANRARLRRWQLKAEALKRAEDEAHRRAEIVANVRAAEARRQAEVLEQAEREAEERVAALEATAGKRKAAERAEQAILEGRRLPKSILARE